MTAYEIAALISEYEHANDSAAQLFHESNWQNVEDPGYADA